ncbi:MAG: insulinase family protein [Proteobacteria bacterium]|nr:insulinase family protein [Pseudomonadota bacterium]MBU1648618.1 insulinase family protein [Pseudomonadota bacterium]MBU1985934.1 insulinase family protein [Pseudomonadota bacterium]
MPFIPGQSYSSFTLKRHAKIAEIGSDVYLFEHDVLGCPLLAIKNSDPNKTFAAAFNTTPTDSTGVAHILEHSVLMGSKKYPVNDVFGEINKGGLMTFLNAMTGSDITYYPFATRNLKEYFNIMDVYCDVVFNPLLTRTTFEQEGWHYHQEEENGELEFQGVVYNEMKGAFSDPIRLLFHHIFGGLMPGSTYAHESGGDPKNIPDLSYEAFCTFHKQHYHPSNSTFFVYGDAPLEDELRYLQDHFLKAFPVKGNTSRIEAGRDVEQITFIEDRYGVESEETAAKTFLAVGQAVSTVLNREDNAAFQVIAGILYNSDASPLKNKIVSSGLGKDFGGLYLCTSSFKTFMVTYLVGSDPDKRDPFLALYNETLQEMVRAGLDRDLLLSELNKYEFAVREEASKAQRGLDLFGKVMPAFKYGTDPFETLEIDELFRVIRHKALEERYFEDLIERYLLENKATVVVTLIPDPEKLAQTQDEERGRLENHAATLTGAQRQELLARTSELQRHQQTPNSPESLAVLPHLSHSDLESHLSFHVVQPHEMFGGVQVLVSELATEHISYVDMGFDISVLPTRLLPWLDLFATIVTEIGTRKMDFMHLARELGTSTGDFSHSFNIYSKLGNAEQVEPVLWFQMKCLPEYQERAMQLMAEIFSELSFEDRAHIKEIVHREFAWSEHSAQSEGYSLAASRAFAHLGLAGAYNEMISGVSSYRAEKELDQNYLRLEEEFLAALQEMANLLFNRNNLILAITGDPEEIATFSRHGAALVAALPANPVTRQILTLPELPAHEALITSAEIVFAVQAGSLLPNGAGYNGHFEVLKNYLSRDYLWNTVRQMGGAYGCFIQFSHITGNIGFVSYRDPQVRKTYDSYAAIPGIISGMQLSDEALEQLVIGTYGNFDPLQSSAAKGATARNEYLSGITPAHKQQRIEEIISTRVRDMQDFAPAFTRMLSSSHRAVIGNRIKIEKDRDLFEKISEL